MSSTPPHITGGARSFELIPLTPAAAHTRRIHAQQSGQVTQRVLGVEAAQWIPTTAPVARRTRFTITAHETTNPRYPGGTAYFVAVDPVGKFKTNVFGLSNTLDGAKYLAGMYMAAPTPTTRYGYLLDAYGLQPVVWVDKASRTRHFQSALHP